MGCGGSKQQETVSNPVAARGQPAAPAVPTAPNKEAVKKATPNGNSPKNPHDAALKIQGLMKRKLSAKNAAFANHWKVINITDTH
jgi:hypothetical protein